MAALSFTLKAPERVAQYTPRLGALSLRRQDGTTPPAMETPALITASSRGVVPHLSQDHVLATKAIRWIDLHFESFLEHTPPILTLQDGPHPLHRFLGFSPEQHILSLSLRDPHDGRDMPANGKDFVSALCIRGVRKMSMTDWKEYIARCQPDIVTALSDVPLFVPPHSQKRTTKSLERSTAWLADLLGFSNKLAQSPFVLVNMVGGVEERARRAFSECLVETLYGKDLEQINPLRTLDEGLSGYVFDLVPLRANIAAERKEGSGGAEQIDRIVGLLNTSLQPLPVQKLRIVHSSSTPHETLRLIRDVGVDLFDARWAQRAADIGVALDFGFPAPSPRSTADLPRTAQGKLPLGHNLFSSIYAQDHSRLASAFLGAASVLPSEVANKDICLCAACSPVAPSTHIVHSSIDRHTDLSATSHEYMPPFTRAYIHHLLNTHEMSSHSLLAMHNLTVMDAFFAGVREVLNRPDAMAALSAEVDRFMATYDEDMSMSEEAHVDWARVERERGKGRLAREKATQSA